MEKTCLMNGQDLYYRDIGAGAPVILIHGFAEDGKVWDALIPFLSKSFRLIIPDLPGSGHSPLAIIENQPTTIETLAACIEQIATAEKLIGAETAPTLIGHSMGGYIALAYASKFSNKWKGLVLFHSTAYSDSDERKEARRKSLSFVKAHGVSTFLNTTIPSFFSTTFLKKYPEIVELHTRKYSQLTADALAWYYEAMLQRPDRTEILKKCSQPIGFILGSEDKLIPPEQILAQASLPQISFHKILLQSGHMGMIEEAEKSGAFLDEFLKELNKPD